MTLLKTRSYLTSFIAISGFALIGLLFATHADAQTTENVQVEVTFVAVITIAAPTNELQFGLLDVLMPASDTLTIDPDNTVSGDTVNIIGGTQGSADLTITATSGAGISILVDSITSGADYSLATFMCSYNGGSDTVCDSAMNVTAVASGVLRVGATLTAGGGATAGNQDGNFDVTVSYQ